MQASAYELRFLLQRHEPHGRAGRRFGDRLGVAVVVLLRLHIRPNVFGRHQANLVTLHPADRPTWCARSTPPSPPCTAAASQKPRKSVSRHPPAQHYTTGRIQARDTATVLAQVDPEHRDVHHPVLLRYRGNPTRLTSGGAGHPIITHQPAPGSPYCNSAQPRFGSRSAGGDRSERLLRWGGGHGPAGDVMLARWAAGWLILVADQPILRRSVALQDRVPSTRRSDVNGPFNPKAH